MLHVNLRISLNSQQLQLEPYQKRHYPSAQGQAPREDPDSNTVSFKWKKKNLLEKKKKNSCEILKPN